MICALKYDSYIQICAIPFINIVSLSIVVVYDKINKIWMRDVVAIQKKYVTVVTILPCCKIRDVACLDSNIKCNG